MKISVRRVPMRVPGFRFAGVHCGLKESHTRDVAVICSDVPAAAAAAFTTNRIKAAPVLLGIERLRRGRLQAIVVNSGNANAYTGRDGLRVASEMCALVGRTLGIDEQLVIPSSTGRIGVPLPRAQVRRGVQAACRQLSRDAFFDALEGIMTSDAFPKFAAEGLVIDGRELSIVGMAKGAGMIAPRLTFSGNGAPIGHATTLAYVLTDAAASAAALRQALAVALPQSFNAIVVDGDTSTNDTVVLMANGVAGNRRITPASAALPAFCAAVTRVLQRLSRMIVQDGEGATKVIDIRVHGARTQRDAERVADTVARSPLCKTAFFGGDPYAGRIVMAVGYSGAIFDPEKMDVFFDQVQVVRRGHEVTGKVERRATAVVAQPGFTLSIFLHAGKATAHRIASDLSPDYVRFNSAYRT